MIDLSTNIGTCHFVTSAHCHIHIKGTSKTIIIHFQEASQRLPSQFPLTFLAHKLIDMHTLENKKLPRDFQNIFLFGHPVINLHLSWSRIIFFSYHLIYICVFKIQLTTWTLERYFTNTSKTLAFQLWNGNSEQFTLLWNWNILFSSQLDIYNWQHKISRYFKEFPLFVFDPDVHGRKTVLQNSYICSCDAEIFYSAHIQTYIWKLDIYN